MLLDTGGLLCFLDTRDYWNPQAAELFRSATQRVTHSYVLAELVALCQARNLPRAPVLRFSIEILDNAAVEVVWITEDIHRQALEMLQERPDKRYSLCDAVSFVVMRERGLTEALTTDRHFDQEGFTRLLPESQSPA